MAVLGARLESQFEDDAFAESYGSVLACAVRHDGHVHVEHILSSERHVVGTRLCTNLGQAHQALDGYDRRDDEEFSRPPEMGADWMRGVHGGGIFS